MKAANKMSASEFKKVISRRQPLSDDFIATLKNHADCLRVGLVLEYPFHSERKWRFDLAWPDRKVAVECDGMVWQAGGGRHNTDADRDKINTAVVLGWRVLRFSGKQIKSDPIGCVDILAKTLENFQSEVR